MKFRLTSEYGKMSEVRDHAHNGIDFSMPEGTTLRSITDGVITKVFNESTDIGKGVAIKTDDGTTHIFGHMNNVSVYEGKIVHTGDIIGHSGNTGHSTAPHLHFGVQQSDGTFVDPTPLADNVSAVSGDIGFWDKILKENNLDKSVGENGQLNNFEHSDLSFWNWFKDKGQVDQYNPSGDSPIWTWIQIQLHDLFLAMWHWFILNLPDIMGYITILAGILIILNSMIGKGGMIKTLGWYSGLLILATCILGGNK